MKQQILQLRAEGRSYNEIVNLLGCSKSTVAYHCSDNVKIKSLRRKVANRDRINEKRRLGRRYCTELSRRYRSLCGCKDCGIRDYRVLEYDHVRDTKLYEISYLVNANVSIDLLKTEIRKCEVVCANCHRIRTLERRKKPL